MGFDKPSDLFVMVGVFVIVLLVGTLGVISVQTNQNATLDPRLTATLSLVNQSAAGNLSSVSSQVNDALTEDTSAGDSPAVDNIIVRSWNALKSLGESYTVAVENTEDVSRIFGIDDRITTVALGILISIFAVIMYAYIRGIK